MDKLEFYNKCARRKNNSSYLLMMGHLFFLSRRFFQNPNFSVWKFELFWYYELFCNFELFWNDEVFFATWFTCNDELFFGDCELFLQWWTFCNFEVFWKYEVFCNYVCFEGTNFFFNYELFVILFRYFVLSKRFIIEQIVQNSKNKFKNTENVQEKSSSLQTNIIAEKVPNFKRKIQKK